jgi:hypothetical protein
MASGISFRFKTDRFDYQSALPDEYNAGNRFYGKDVGEFLVTELAESGHQADCIDEDWGWMVCCGMPDEHFIEVAIYNLSDHMEGGRLGAPEWGLAIQSYRRKKLLGILPRTMAVDVLRDHIDFVERVFEKSAIELEPWPDGSNAKGE